MNRAVVDARNGVAYHRHNRKDWWSGSPYHCGKCRRSFNNELAWDVHQVCFEHVQYELLVLDASNPWQAQLKVIRKEELAKLEKVLLVCLKHVGKEATSSAMEEGEVLLLAGGKGQWPAATMPTEKAFLRAALLLCNLIQAIHAVFALLCQLAAAPDVDTAKVNNMRQLLNSLQDDAYHPAAKSFHAILRRAAPCGPHQQPCAVALINSGCFGEAALEAPAVEIPDRALLGSNFFPFKAIRACAASVVNCIEIMASDVADSWGSQVQQVKDSIVQIKQHIEAGSRSWNAAPRPCMAARNKDANNHPVPPILDDPDFLPKQKRQRLV